jgi:hypothetical protein
MIPANRGSFAMRIALVTLPFLMLAAPVAAAPEHGPIQLPPEMTDPTLGQKMGKIAGALSKAFMDLNVGEIEAAVEGRKPTAADRNRKVRDMAGGQIDERVVEEQVAAATPAMQRGMQAMANSLPAILEAMRPAIEEIERATANLPQPGYPRR